MPMQTARAARAGWAALLLVAALVAAVACDTVVRGAPKGDAAGAADAPGDDLRSRGDDGVGPGPGPDARDGQAAGGDARADAAGGPDVPPAGDVLAPDGSPDSAAADSGAADGGADVATADSGAADGGPDATTADSGAADAAPDVPAPACEPHAVCCVDGSPTAEGLPCDDRSDCTVDERCSAGSCKGTRYDCPRPDCASRVECDGSGGCVATVRQNWCLIDGQCVADGQVSGADPCLRCESASDPDAWTPVPGCP